MHDQFCSYQIIIFIGDFRFGGAEVVGVNLANAFVAHGLHVRLIVLRKDGSLLPRLNRKVEIISLETKIITALPKLLKQLIALNSKTNDLDFFDPQPEHSCRHFQNFAQAFKYQGNYA